MYKSEVKTVNVLAQIAEKELLKVLNCVSFTSKSSDASERKVKINNSSLFSSIVGN